jgi:hypothetical protein
VAVTPSKDAEVEVGLIHQFQRRADGIGIAGGQMLHRLRKEIHALAGFDDLVAVLRQVM